MLLKCGLMTLREKKGWARKGAETQRNKGLSHKGEEAQRNKEWPHKDAKPACGRQGAKKNLFASWRLCEKKKIAS
jgi:hypothetical protein